MQSKQKPSLDDVCILLADVGAEYDSVGNVVVSSSEREVWCAETPVAAAEVERARQCEIMAEAVIVVDASEYQGEGKVRVGGRTLDIYRTYTRADGLVELYAGEKVTRDVNIN